MLNMSEVKWENMEWLRNAQILMLHLSVTYLPPKIAVLNVAN